MQVKMKQSLDWPGQALRVLEVEVPRICRHSAHEIGKVSPKHQPPLSPPPPTPGDTTGTHFSWSLSRPQGHSAAGRIESVNLDDPIGTEPANCRLVVECLNQLCHRVPKIYVLPQGNGLCSPPPTKQLVT